MSFLGDAGSLYMLFLIALLIIGLGMLAKGFIEYIFKSDSKSLGNNKSEKKSSYWFKFSILSLAGIMISLIILSLMSSQGFSDGLKF